MKNTKMFLAGFAMVAMAAGCDKPASSTADNYTNSMMATQEMANVNSPMTNAAMTNSGAPGLWEKTKAMTTNAMENVKSGTTNAWAATKSATIEAWKDIKESVGSIGDYSYDKKDGFVTKAGADIDALDQKIKDYSDNVASTTDSVKADAQAKLQSLADKRSDLNQKYDDVKNATEANWSDAKSAFKSAYDDAKSAVKEDWQWLKDKMNS